MIINDNINKINNLSINEKKDDKSSSMPLKKNNIDIKSKKTDLDDKIIINKNIDGEIKKKKILIII